MDTASSSPLVIGVVKETRDGERRAAVVPEIIKKLSKKGFHFHLENGLGASSGYDDKDYSHESVKFTSRDEALKSDFVFKIQRPTEEEVSKMKPGALLISLLEPYKNDGLIEKLAEKKIDAVALEFIPRTSRGQSMDVLSSQANIAGYRAVIEAASQYPRFFPMMMTSAGSAKPAKVIILGAGVAGLQAIGVARRLGAAVEAYDVRPEVKEQILSLGAKFIELDIGESGSGTGGYAKELSEESKKKQQQLLTDKLKTADIIITTANVPGRKAPTLITEEAVKGMRTGSVIIDMAAPSGGNCALTEPGKVVEKHNVTIVGHLDYPSMVAADSSSFFARNIMNLFVLFFEEKEKKLSYKINLEDDIIAASLVTMGGADRRQKK